MVMSLNLALDKNTWLCVLESDRYIELFKTYYYQSKLIIESVVLNAPNRTFIYLQSLNIRALK